MIFINYHNITYPDQNNGDGLRVVLWLSGCSHRCKGCQNQQTWDANSGIPFDQIAKEELFRELNKNYISGLTLSGGDPLNDANLNDVLNIINELRFLLPGKTIWLYTGYTWESIWDNKIQNIFESINKVENIYLRQQITSKCDILVDGRYSEIQRDITLKWRGSSNQRVINIQKSLQQKKVILYCD